MSSPTAVVAYLTGEYPRATDTFIQREIAAVERCGVRVERFAVRRPEDIHMVGAEQIAERDRTTYLLGGSPLDHVRALMGAAASNPGRFASAIRLAATTHRLGIRGALKQVAYLVEAATLAGEMRRRGVTHLHNHFGDSSGSVALLASELSGITFSMTLHGPAIFFEPSEWNLSAKLERSAFTVAISSFARSQASLFCGPEHWDRIRIVHCGVTAPEPQRESEGEPEPERDRQAMASERDSPCECLFVGRLDPVKGVVVLFDAVAQLVERGVPLRLTLVGDGPQRADLERRTAELGLDEVIRFVGYRSQAEVAEHLAAADLFVLPSFAEGVPVSLMEAMSQEVAVIATNVGGVTELVDDEVNGRVVAPGDVDELADAIGRLAGDPGLRRRMGQAGRAKVVADFDSATEARRLVTLFIDPSSPSPHSVRPAEHI